jgi:hypothetical protein
MATINDLNFEVIFYKDDAAVLRQVLNFLIPDVLSTIEDYFLKSGHNFYTDFEIRFRGNVVLRKSLVGDRITEFGAP